MRFVPRSRAWVFDAVRYLLAKTDLIDPAIASPEWEKAETATVAVDRWAGYAPVPKTTVKLLRSPEGISVLMHTEEKGLRATHTEDNGEICEDSCMEFFLKPSNLKPEYLNFELNPRGTLHLGMGVGREDRVFPKIDRTALSIESIPNEGDWTLKLYIPDALLLSLFGEISPIVKANFYKCGELTDHSHFGTWAEVETPRPDFHQPDFFGFLVL